MEQQTEEDDNFITSWGLMIFFIGLSLIMIHRTLQLFNITSQILNVTILYTLAFGLLVMIGGLFFPNVSKQKKEVSEK